jgi:hypothetical protein
MDTTILIQYYPWQILTLEPVLHMDNKTSTQ